jgi:hypothetical protein
MDRDNRAFALGGSRQMRYLPPSHGRHPLTSLRHESRDGYRRLRPDQPLAALTFENRLRMRSSSPSQTSR